LASLHQLVSFIGDELFSDFKWDKDSALQKSACKIVMQWPSRG